MPNSSQKITIDDFKKPLNQVIFLAEIVPMALVLLLTKSEWYIAIIIGLCTSIPIWMIIRSTLKNMEENIE